VTRELANEFVSRSPHPRLRPFVEMYTGYRIAGVTPGTHAGLPSRSLTMIVAFDDPLVVEHGSGTQRSRRRFWAMLGGLHTSPALVHHPGHQSGVQLRITPQGAAALFGTPAAELAHEVIPLDAVFPEATVELVDRLSAESTWSARWAVLDDILLRVMTAGDGMAPEVDAAWAIMAQTNGLVGIEELASRVGWSRRNLTVRFKQQFGLSPKAMARVMRFEHAEKLLRLPTRPSLASVAHACGYADQAHMTREWVEFAGSPPTTWMTDETIPFVQDEDEPPPSEWSS